MDPRSNARLAVSILCGLLAAGLGFAGLSVMYGLAAEYSGGTAVSLLPVAVLGAAGLAALSVAAWPGSAPSVRVAVPLVVALVVGLGGLGADRLGDRAHAQRLLAGSERFACNGPNAEILVDGRVDETFAELPRRAPIYGPVQGSRYGCTAAVHGDGSATFAAYADAFRDLEGWAVTTDRPARFVMERDGVRVVMVKQDQLAMIEVSVPPATGRAAS